MDLMKWRKGMKLSRVRLGAMLDVTPMTVKRYEIGERVPPPDIMVDLFLLSGGVLRPDHLMVPSIERLYQPPEWVAPAPLAGPQRSAP